MSRTLNKVSVTQNANHTPQSSVGARMENIMTQNLGFKNKTSESSYLSCGITLQKDSMLTWAS